MSPQNELSVYELVHNFVEVLDKYFSRVVSLDPPDRRCIMFVLLFVLQSDRCVSVCLHRVNWTYPFSSVVCYHDDESALPV